MAFCASGNSAIFASDELGGEGLAGARSTRAGRSTFIGGAEGLPDEACDDTLAPDSNNGACSEPDLYDDLEHCRKWWRRRW